MPPVKYTAPAGAKPWDNTKGGRNPRSDHRTVEKGTGKPEDRQEAYPLKGSGKSACGQFSFVPPTSSLPEAAARLPRRPPPGSIRVARGTRPGMDGNPVPLALPATPKTLKRPHPLNEDGRTQPLLRSSTLSLTPPTTKMEGLFVAAGDKLLRRAKLSIFAFKNTVQAPPTVEASTS